jgi:hypothetical protein
MKKLGIGQIQTSFDVFLPYVLRHATVPSPKLAQRTLSFRLLPLLAGGNEAGRMHLVVHRVLCFSLSRLFFIFLVEKKNGVFHQRGEKTHKKRPHKSAIIYTSRT